MLLLCSGMMFAQYPANRTAKTIVADVLAQMPAQQTEQYYNQIKDLASTGEEGVLQLVKMMNLPEKGSNAQVEYALSGLSHYVSAQGMEAQRLITSNAYIKALEMTGDREIRAFIIRQLALVGKDEAVAKLSTYLDNESLSGPAAAALSAIDTPSSQKALLNALSISSDDKSEESVILAVAKLKIADAENTLKRLLDTTNPDKRKTVLYALSRTGSKASLPELASAAEKDNYSMQKDGGNEAYIVLIKRVLSQGDKKEAEKAAADLMKKAEKAGQAQTQQAALEILMKAQPVEAAKLLQNALKDSDRNYRYAALTCASDYADSRMYGELVKSLKKVKPEAQLDILNWLGQECDSRNKCDVIKPLVNKTAISYLKTRNSDIRKAAAEILTKTADQKAIAALAYLLNNADPKTVEMAKNALSSTKGDIASAVVPVIATANITGKVAGLQLLAQRKSSANAATVFGLVNSGSPDVKTAAYTALKDVVSVNDLAKLYSLLEGAEQDNVSFVQQAIASVLKSYPADKQYETILARMNQAGKEKQYLYYPVLASTGNTKALEMIADRFNKEEDAAKDAAFQALLDWKDISVADELLTVCKKQSDILYFDRAINRYVQLVSDPKLTGENRRLFLNNALDIARTDAQKNTVLNRMGNTGSYLGMLKAGEYLDNKALQEAAAHAVMNIALANKQYTGKNVETLLNKVINVLDNPDAEYQRQELRKHLAEMPKEEGFVSVFNGKDLTGWNGLVGNPVTRTTMKQSDLDARQIEADKKAEQHWKAENGILVFDGLKGGDNLCTKKQYGDMEMYIDWKLDPAGPEADAGIYLRGTPQVQIWDTSRVNVGAQVGSGGLYNNRSNPNKPLKVADNKLGEWNNFYIKMAGDRVTVKLNGELVVDNVILENFWDRNQSIFPIEQIELQAHGSKVYYRNIYVKELEKAKPFELSAEEKKESFRILFDGTNMHEWTGNTVDYQLQDGCIALDPKGKHGGNLYTKDEFSDFIYRFEFLLTPAANNGVGIRTPMGVDAAYHGMEIQILDHDHPVYKNITPLQVHGSVYGIIGAKRAKFKPIGEWNQEEIIADGNHIKVTLNGEVILDGDIEEATRNGTADHQKHPGLFNPKGHIGFLGHGSPVKFRNIRIKVLK
jgi:HEAT repeat protein